MTPRFLVSLFLLLAVSCASHRHDIDVFPQGYEARCEAARNRAISWYQHKYRENPAVPYSRVTLKDKPLGDKEQYGAWTIGHNIEIWRDQKNFDGSLEHEFRHVLCLRNGKGGSEEAVR